jgi:hypothetical protein
VKLEDVPSAKAKDDITRISNFLVQSTILDKTFRLERCGFGIGFLVVSHAPVNVISVNTLAYFEDEREPTISS